MRATRVTQGFTVDADGQDSGPRRPRSRAQIMAGEGRRPPASVPLSDLAHNPLNPREELTEIEETAASLTERGQLQPVAVVRRAAFLAVHPDQESAVGTADYVVIDGNRRLAAAHVAGLVELRIDVNDALATSATDLLESALIANVHRVDVPPIEQARAIRALLDTHGTQSAVARKLSKTEGWVSQRLALLRLPEDLQEQVDTGALPVREARRIGRLPAERQHAEAAAVAEQVQARPPRRALSTERTAGRTATAEPASVPEQAAAPPTPAPASHLPELPWDAPEEMAGILRAHMTASARDQLVLILMGDA